MSETTRLPALPVSEDLRRRYEAAAARRNMSLTGYLNLAGFTQLERDGMAPPPADVEGVRA
jgi:hypothetical protein